METKSFMSSNNKNITINFLGEELQDIVDKTALDELRSQNIFTKIRRKLVANINKILP